MSRQTFCLLFFICNCLVAAAQHGPNTTTDVEKIQFVYDDIHRFNEAYRQLETVKDSIAVLNNVYFSKASEGLQLFIRQYGLTDSGLLRTVRKFPRTYAGVKDVIETIESDKLFYTETLRKYQSILPSVVFPPFYFLIGERLGINSGSRAGILFEVETWKPGDHVLYSSVMSHELTHFQQRTHIGHEKYIAIYGEEKTLLALTIREGVAEFFADLVTGRYTQEQTRSYVEQHEKELWERFQQEMDGKETGDWMFVQPVNKDQPRDVAYILGAKIVQHYYDSAIDKQKALEHILNITDYKLFLQQSRYVEKFDRRSAHN